MKNSEWYERPSTVLAPIDVLEGAEVIYHSSTGQAWYRSCGSVQEFHCQGHMSEAMGAAIISRVDAALRRFPKISVFHDWHDLETYAVDLRVGFSDRLKDIAPGLDEFHICIKAPLLAYAMTLSDLSLAQIHKSRRPFDEARMRAIPTEDLEGCSRISSGKSETSLPSKGTEPELKKIVSVRPIEESSDLPVPQRIRYLDGVEIVCRSPKAQAWHRSTGPVQEFMVDGHMTDGVIAEIITRSEKVLKVLTRVTFFHDWQGLKTYSIDARFEYVRWLEQNADRLEGWHALAVEPLIVEALSLSDFESRENFHIYRERRPFDLARARAMDPLQYQVSATVPVDGAIRRPPSHRPHRLPVHPPSIPSDEMLTGDSNIADVEGPRLKPGELLDDRYRIIASTGSGGSATVYRAEDIELEREVSIKLLKSFIARSGQATVLQEARTLASLRHANVVSVYDCRTHDALPYIVMEYVSGGDLGEVLESHIRRRAQIPLPSGLKIAKAVAEALCAVHAGGLIHRDVKPENVILEEGSARVVLVDFGLARSRNDVEAGGERGLLFGTPAYMAPELWTAGAAGSCQSDLYAWGVMTYELLTGVPPFLDTDLRELARLHQVGEVTPPSKYRPELAELDELLLATLAKDPGARPRSGSAIAAVLGDVIEGKRARSYLLDAYEGTLRVLLLVSDRERSALVGQAVGEAFGAISHMLVHSSSAEQALKTCAQYDFDLTIVDSILPDMHGVEWIAQRREQSRSGKTLEVVLEPSSCDEEWWLRALGVERFLLAPLVSSKLRAYLIDLGIREGWLV